MIKVIITEIDGYNYTLKDNKEKSYKINIEFYGLYSNPTINDVIYINEKLLQEIENKPVSFGPLDEKYGKTINYNNNTDIICITTKEGNIYLKRFYG